MYYPEDPYADDDSTRYSHHDRAGQNHRKPPSSTGAEALFFKEAVESGQEITVVLKSGERLVGKIRYYDHASFSMGLSTTGLNVLLRKEDVKYLVE